MAALLARAILQGGKVVELYDTGLLWIIDSEGKQEIKLMPAGAVDLFVFLAEQIDDLHQSAKREMKTLEETYGAAATHSEHRRGEIVTYQADGFTYSGEILWACAPSRAGDKDLPLRYVVAPALDNSFVDIVFPSDILTPSE